MTDSITPSSTVTLTVRLNNGFSCLPSSNLNQLDVFILGPHQALGQDLLKHAKAFKHVEDQELTFVHTVDLPAEQEYSFRLFCGVSQEKTIGEKELSILSIERSARSIELCSSPRQEFDLGIFGETRFRPLKNPSLIDDQAFTLTFSEARGPCLALDFDDAEQFSIDVVSAQACNYVNCFSSEEARPMFQNKMSSVVCYECRCFQHDLSNFRLYFQVTKADEEVIGTFEFNFEQIKQSQGILTLPIMSGNRVGSIKCEYLHVKPFAQNEEIKSTHPIVDKLVNERTLPRGESFEFWTESNRLLRGGHRGSGNSFTGDRLSNIRENTIDSFRAAHSPGKADFVEFDVTNTRDYVPVVYHDLGLAIDDHVTTIKMQTFSALQEACQSSPTRVKHLSQVDARKGKFELNFDVDEAWTMPRLSDMFSELPDDLAFNLEVKWPHCNIEGKSENSLHDNFFDINRYIDEILSVVMPNCGQRKLIFSCFDPNVCYCLQVKQSTYPVMQLTNGDSGHYVDARDLRTRRNSTAVKWARQAGFVAINTLVKDVLDGYELLEKCNEAGLKLCVYGDDMQNDDILKRLKNSKLDALCYDLVHKVQ